MSINEYPNLWIRGLIQERVRELADHKCEHCGMEFEEGTNIAKTVKRRDGHAMVGTVHHINMDRADNRMVNLVYLCQRCHWTVHLIGWKPGRMIPPRWRNNEPRWLVERGYIKQLKLFTGDNKNGR